MNASKAHWTITALVALVAVLLTLLATQAVRSGGPAYAQSEGVSANYVIGILGQEKNDRVPLVILDTKAQTVLVYEYVLSRRNLYLRVARSFAAERELVDENFGQTNIYEGPTVREVQEMIRKRGAPTPGGRTPY